ncbi:hypothetical protein Taro_019780 [Colocasia esculenta]|uniref:Uncharacterized protein n=1 Tax=Colocasia esculenta TaxID=4460 RepID=A0A843V6I9_COLES|nr:hypothetical protein [Colocasia esculenta]
MEVALGKGSAPATVSTPCGEVASPSEGEGGGFVEQQMQVARRVKRRTLVEVLEQCRRALELLKDSDVEEGGGSGACPEEGEGEEGDSSLHDSSSSAVDSEADELNSLLKSRVDSPKFLEKLGNLQKSVSQNVSGDEGTTWDVITAKDLWDDKYSAVEHGSNEEDDDYVLVKQEDIVDGIACFMAAYLLSLKETKELTPNQLQEGMQLLAIHFSGEVFGEAEAGGGGSIGY